MILRVMTMRLTDEQIDKFLEKAQRTSTSSSTFDHEIFDHEISIALSNIVVAELLQRLLEKYDRR